jgi:RES domain
LIHDPDLIDRLAGLPKEAFVGEVFRATRISLDPRAFSTRAGRWGSDGGVGVLYTSLAREGALAEIAFHWSRLTPLPSKPAVLHRLRVSTIHALRLTRPQLPTLGIDLNRFGELNYIRTQEIGAAIAFLGCDGLIAPSARWNCENLMLFSDNQVLESQLEVLASEEVDWLGWGREQGIIS